MAQLLFEIFCEEIPARMQAQAARDLERMAREHLSEAGLEPDSLRTFSGPRRLTLVAEGLPAATPDVEEERKGPRVGSPDAAIEGFLRSTGLKRSDLVERDGVYFAAIARKGRPTPEIIAAMAEAVVRGLPWPKSMRWGTGTLRWIRPIQRILCVFGGEIVPFTIEGIESGDVTEGHRFMGSGKPFKAASLAAYEKGLAAHFVVLDPRDRKARIVDGAHQVCATAKVELIEDDGLLDEVAGLAEWPTPVLGRMDPAFLDLPAEVIRTSMRTHQKYFAVRDPKTGGLAPHFVTVANIEADDGGAEIAAGNARVLSARLNDARFFWDEDRKAGNFDRWLKRLEGVTFHAKLGTMAERVERLAALARDIAPLVGADPEKAAAAARLAKADLASGMVGEFPELQGVMGGYYAREAGKSALTAEAIRDHYKPQGPNDAVPETPLAMAVALADKVDTLAGFFAAGERPTGSKDPYALRRAALGLIRILAQGEVRVGVRELVGFWYGALKTYARPGRALFISGGGVTAQLGARWVEQPEEYAPYLAEIDDALKVGRASVVTVTEEDPDGVDFDRAARGEVAPKNPVVFQFRPYPEVADELTDFLADRLKVVLKDQGRRHDLVDAVFALGDDDLVRIAARVDALDAFLKSDDGANLLAGYKRASNILKAEEKRAPLPDGVAVSLINAPAEEAVLVAAVAAALPIVDAAIAGEDFPGALRALAGLRAAVDPFFTAVLVNSEVAAERDNRLRLLQQVRAATAKVADFSKIAG